MKYSSFVKRTFVVGFVIAAIITKILLGTEFFSDMPAESFGNKVLGVITVWSMVGIICTFIINLWFVPKHVNKFLSLIKTKVDKQYKDSETYIYTRDLPEYNAAIAGMLYDFKSTFEEDYIAGVMDLIIKGYIIEEEKYLKINYNKTRENLLECEMYILKSCEFAYQNIDNVINFEFYKALKKDMFNLGFYKNDSWLERIKTRIQYFIKMKNKLIRRMGYFFGIVFVTTFFWGIDTELKLKILGLILVCIACMIYLRKTRLTRKGEDEKESITKLKLFLENETAFKDKALAEKKMWDRYPAFAVALGVNKEMSEKITIKLKTKNKEKFL